MAHEIEKNNAFFVSTPAWHELGTVLTDAPSIEQAWKLAYPHNLLKLPLEAFITDQDGNKQTMPVQSHSAIVRDDGKRIGVVGSRYELVQPYEAFKFFEPWIESGEVELEAGGSLRGGSRMWALAKVRGAESDIMANDPVKAYFLIFTSFDGSLSHGIKFCATRVVCANTLAMAQREQTSGFKLKHTRDIRDRIEAIQQTVNCVKADFSGAVESYKRLAEKRMTAQGMKAYIRSVFEPEREKTVGVTETTTRFENKVNLVIDLLDSQRGLELVPAMRGTAWQAYNAVTDYLTHSAGRNDDSRLDSQWFGASRSLNGKALEMALTC